MASPLPSPDAEPASGGGALARLRERVEAAAEEIERLRTENARLADRVARIGENGGGGPTLPTSGDPAALRSSIQSFIDAVDRVLDSPSETGT